MDLVHVADSVGNGTAKLQALPLVRKKKRQDSNEEWHKDLQLLLMSPRQG
jgi:hypothetical protein